MTDCLTKGAYGTVSKFVTSVTQANGTYPVEAILNIFDSKTVGMKGKQKIKTRILIQRQSQL